MNKNSTPNTTQNKSVFSPPFPGWHDFAGDVKKKKKERNIPVLMNFASSSSLHNQLRHFQAHSHCLRRIKPHVSHALTHSLSVCLRKKHECRRPRSSHPFAQCCVALTDSSSVVAHIHSITPVQNICCETGISHCEAVCNATLYEHHTRTLLAQLVLVVASRRRTQQVCLLPSAPLCFGLVFGLVLYRYLPVVTGTPANSR